jgi:hypothetical protein
MMVILVISEDWLITTSFSRGIGLYGLIVYPVWSGNAGGKLLKLFPVVCWRHLIRLDMQFVRPSEANVAMSAWSAFSSSLIQLGIPRSDGLYDYAYVFLSTVSFTLMKSKVTSERIFWTSGYFSSMNRFSYLLHKSESIHNSNSRFRLKIEPKIYRLQHIGQFNLEHRIYFRTLQ